MNKFRSAGVAAVFLAGCAVGGASGRLVVPPASAQQAGKPLPPGAMRWDQTCVKIDGGIEDVARVATAYGNNYWELVDSSVFIAGVMLCFKRPKA